MKLDEEDLEVTEFRRGMSQPYAYPHAFKLQRNLLLVSSLTNSLFTAPSAMRSRRKWVENSHIPFTPSPDKLRDMYATTVQELLIETAIFMRAQDDFWLKKSGVTQWPSKENKEHCGYAKFLDGPEEKISLTLRAACDKIIHHEDFDYGWRGSETEVIVFLHGRKNRRKWFSKIFLQEFCFLGMCYAQFPLEMVPIKTAM